MEMRAALSGAGGVSPSGGGSGRAVRARRGRGAECGAGLVRGAAARGLEELAGQRQWGGRAEAARRSYPVALGGLHGLLAGRGARAHAVRVLAGGRVAVRLPLEGVTVPREGEGAWPAGGGGGDGAPEGAPLLQRAAGGEGLLGERRRGREGGGERRGQRRGGGRGPAFPQRQGAQAARLLGVSVLAGLAGRRGAPAGLPGALDHLHLGDLLRVSVGPFGLAAGGVPAGLAGAGLRGDAAAGRRQ